MTKTPPLNPPCGPIESLHAGQKIIPQAPDQIVRIPGKRYVFELENPCEKGSKVIKKLVSDNVGGPAGQVGQAAAHSGVDAWLPPAIGALSTPGLLAGGFVGGLAGGLPPANLHPDHHPRPEARTAPAPAPEPAPVVLVNLPHSPTSLDLTPPGAPPFTTEQPPKPQPPVIVTEGPPPPTKTPTPPTVIPEGPPNQVDTPEPSSGAMLATGLAATGGLLAAHRLTTNGGRTRIPVPNPATPLQGQAVARLQEREEKTAATPPQR